jgi:chemotaxis protein methyltransferase CheR
LGLSSFRDYCALIASDAGVDERQKMMAALTTNVTKFFREPHHFEHLRTTLLPPLLQAARSGAKVRIWSAGCSNGQEPYSIALTIMGLMPEASNFDIKILATDIDPVIIGEAREGVYPATAIENVPPAQRSKWFKPVGRESSPTFKVADEVKQLVTVRELNLIGPWPMKGTFQAIFCRNVTIYFNDETREKLWGRFAKSIALGGYLYIGHSERITGVAAKSFAPSGVTTYRWLGDKA